jgi:hypothetical protein
MQDMLDPQLVRQRLATTPSLKGKADAVDQLEKVIAGLRGITLVASIQDKTMARVEIEFASPLPAIADQLKGVFLDVLAAEQSVPEDFRECSSRIDSNTLVMETELSDAGLRQIMSLVLTPHSAQLEAPATSDTPQTDPAEAAKRRNRRYYAGVVQSLKDLQRFGSWTYTDAAGWCDRYAQKIDNMPIDGIDKDLVQFAQGVSGKMRAMAASLRGMRVEVNAEQRTLNWNVQVNPGSSYYGSGGWGGWRPTPYWSVNSNLGEVREKQAKAVIDSTKEREQLMQSIEDDRGRIRQLMQERYGEDFEKWLF